MRFEGRNELALVHNLAVLYLGVGEGTDGELDARKARVIAACLRRWQPDKDPALIDHVMRDVALSYREETTGDTLNEIIGDLGRYLSIDCRARVLRDLAGVARADGAVLEADQDFIRRIARAWRMEEEYGTSGRVGTAHLPASKSRNPGPTRRADGHLPLQCFS